MVSHLTTYECVSALAVMSARGSAAACLATSASTAIVSIPTATSTTCESGPCSACDKRSAATKAGSASPSAITSTSDGPAGMSIDTVASEFCRIILAAVTYWLPGPKILSTLGVVCVPCAMAATACAPPALSKCVTPAFFAQYVTSGHTLPSLRGGVASTRVEHPAIMAGTDSMSAVEGSTAVPPGTYNPTRSIARLTRPHTTPGIVSTGFISIFCASWNLRMFSNATSNAALMFSSSCGSGRSATGTHTASRSTPSNLDV
mmetsp:Transcript_16424/g.51045  ORF Transcript_16424/g.51045 Transcript_16424/m.51045 type:complete len:261 (+) Transcript_16424:418-1200(+)